MPKNKIKVAHHNIRSLSLHLSGLEDLILSNGLDVVGVTETWLHANIETNQVSIDGYTFIRKDYRSRGSGVGIYINNTLQYKVIRTPSLAEHISVQITINSLRFCVCVVYRNLSLNVNTFTDEIEKLFSFLLSNCDNVLVLGDMNIDLLKHNNQGVNAYKATLQDLEITQLIAEPTRGGALLDHILTSNADFILDSGIISTTLTDHDVIFSTLNVKRPGTPCRFVSYRDYFRADVELVSQSLAESNIESVYYNTDIDTKVEIFTNVILGIANCCAPMQAKKISKSYAPWLTDNIKLMMTERDTAKAKYKRTSSSDDWTQYKQLRNIVTKCINNEKKAYLNSKFNSRDTRTLYRELRRFKIGRKPRSVIPTHLSDVNAINDYFVKGLQRSATNSDLLVSFYNNKQHENVTCEFAFSTVDRYSIIKVLNLIKTNATGHDELCINMLKLCGEGIVNPIVNIINSCILESYFPVQWRKAVCFPLAKTENVSEFTHMRLISVLPVLSKVLERVMALQLTDYLEKYGILPKNQSGFRSLHSCTTTLLHVTDEILRARDKGWMTILVLLDFSRAFDTVDHAVLLSILRFVGLGAAAAELFASFLANRSQKVKLNDFTSEELAVTSGVPQGSILGPLLFTLYTHRLCTGLRYCKAHMYADDTQIFFSFPSGNLFDAISKINEDLNILFETSQQHYLQLNPGKSQVIIFGSSHDCEMAKDLVHVVVNGVELPIVLEAKNLGVTMDNSFRYRTYTAKCVQRAYGNLRLLYPHRAYLSRPLKIRLCENLVLSQFNYCSQLFSPALDVITLNKIQRVQNSCLRLVFGLRKYDHVSQKLVAAGWLNMYNRFRLQELCLYHRIILNKCPPYLYEKITFRTDVHNLNIRRKDTLTAPKHQSSLFERSFTYRVFKLYSDLPVRFKMARPGRFRALLAEITS